MTIININYWGFYFFILFNIVKNILNPFAEKFKDEAIFANENSTVDTVPITWEKK